MKKIMWDLCCGLGGASQAFRANGWSVVTVDVNPIFKPDILKDISDIDLRGAEHPDFVWASPPCVEFALRRFDQSIEPSLNLVVQARRLIHHLSPKYWAIENVRNSVPYINQILGPHRLTVGPYFLWGNFPLFIPRPVPLKSCPKGPHWLRSINRSKIPLSLSEDMEGALSYMLGQLDGELAVPIAGSCAGRPRTRTGLDPGALPGQEPTGDRRDVAAIWPAQGPASAASRFRQ